MSRPSKKNPKSKVVFVRVSEEQHALFVKAAKADNRTLSSWVRIRLLQAS